uniref:Uncharacterized protein n=1 Tax=Arundo donax TaxID=35708 RepID=A0A0A9FSY7_ARUDO
MISASSHKRKNYTLLNCTCKNKEKKKPTRIYKVLLPVSRLIFTWQWFATSY